MQFTDYDNYLNKTVRNLLGDLAREKYLSNWQVFANENVVSVTLRFSPVSHEGQPVGGYSLRHKSPSTIRRDRSRYNERRQLRFDSEVTPVCNKSISCNLDSDIRTIGSSVKPISTDSGYCCSDSPVKVVPDSQMQYSKREPEHDSSIIYGHSSSKGGSAVNTSVEYGSQTTVADPQPTNSSPVSDPETKKGNTEDDDTIEPISYFKIVVEENTPDSDSDSNETLLAQTHDNEYVRYSVQQKSMEFCSKEEIKCVQHHLLQNGSVFQHPKYRDILVDFCLKLEQHWESKIT